MNTGKIKKANDFIESKPLTLSKDMYGGYRITYSYLVSLLEEYAQLHHQTKIEEAGRELPSMEKINEMYPERTSSGTYLETNMGRREGAKDMRSEASKIIAKEIEGKANTTNLLMRKISQANDLVLDREKEIEDLKSQLSKLKADGGETVYKERDVFQHPPLERGVYITDIGKLEFNHFDNKNEWFVPETNQAKYPSYWLEPINLSIQQVIK